MDIDPDLNLIGGLPDAVKRQIHQHLAKSSAPSALVPDTGPLKTSGICISDYFVTRDVCEAARLEAESLLDASGRQAGMGGAAADTCHNAAFRGDCACWVPYDQRAYPALKTTSDAIIALQKGLENQGYDVGGKPTIQLACYPGNGSSYARHADASDSAPNRTLTAILYLNPDWDSGHQGQLCVYNHSRGEGLGFTSGEPASVIAPKAGRLVIFDSRLSHEVLPTFNSRYALTVWFKKSAEAAVDKKALSNSSAPLQKQRICQQPIGSTSEQIFISIAAFRDSETRWTVQDLLQKASKPDRLRIGIVWQVDAASEADMMELPIPASQKRKIREIRLDYREATGPCNARALAQKLWAGEEYYLQLDAHMRFAPAWDDALLQWLHQAEAEHPESKAVISTYPPGYEGEGPGVQLPLNDIPTLLRASHYGADGMLRLKASRLATCADVPIPSLFWAAGFSFSRSQLLAEVPYQDLPFLFFGEEQAMLARMWTHGYDMYTPPRSIAWHQWSRSHRNTFPSCVLQDAALKAISQEEVLQLFSRPSHGEDTEETTQNGSVHRSTLGLGTVRTIAAFQQTVGVDYSKKQIHPAAIRGCRNAASIEFAGDNTCADVAADSEEGPKT